MDDKEIMSTIKKATDASLAGLSCKQDFVERVLTASRSRGCCSYKRTILIVAAAVMLLVSIVGIAEFRSRLLSRLFKGNIPQRTVDLLHNMPIVVENDDVRVSIDEWLFDGSKLIVEATVINKSEEPLLCTLGDVKVGDTEAEAGYASSLMSGKGTNLTEIAPEVSVSGMATYSCSVSKEDLPCSITLDVLAVRPQEPIVYNAYGGEQPAYEDYVGTEKAEKVLDTVLSFTLDADALNVPETKLSSVNGCCEDGYTVIVDKASFRAASSEIVFRIVPDDVKDIEAYGEEGQSGHARLYRSYAVWVNDEELAYKAISWGWNEAHTQLVYHVEGLPVEEKPHVLKLIPRSDDGTQLKNEATIFTLD